MDDSTSKDDVTSSKSKRSLYIALTAIVFLAAFGGLTIMARNSSTVSYPTTVAKAKAGSTHPAACLASRDTSGLTLSTADRNSLAMVAVTQLIDVPAGTNADVFVKGYDGSVATGSVIYPKDYGHYNFSLQKTGSTQGWQVETFAKCK